MTDEELERLARAATPGPWHPWCDHQPSLDWLCNDKDGLDIVTLAGAGSERGAWPDVCVASLQVMRTHEEEQSLTTSPGNKAAVAANARFIAAFNPATALALLERVRKAEAALLCEHGAEKDYCAASHNAAADAAKRAGLETALRLAEDVEREETSLGNAITASAAEEVKDRIKERIRWLDEGTE